MKRSIYTISAGVLLVSLVSALPDKYNHKFIPAGPNDQRSPCPGLNTCGAASSLTYRTLTLLQSRQPRIPPP